MARPDHYLARREKWQHEGLKKASKSEQDVFALFDEFVDAAKYVVDIKPKDAKDLYMEAYRAHALDGEEARVLRRCGIIPEMSIASKATGKKIFIEVKHQQDAGNAHERAGKYFAPGIVRRLKKIAKVKTFPVFFIFVGDIIDGPKAAKYRAELSTWFDDPSVKDRVLLWYHRDKGLLRDFFEKCIRPAIDHAPTKKAKGAPTSKRRARRTPAA